jgi:cell division septation protein DedD
MPRNEEGDFELILGNTQLLSVFFIVVVLLGVFFTMGYIVGRNSTPATTTRVAAEAPAAVAPPSPVEVAPARQGRSALRGDAPAENTAERQPPSQTAEPPPAVPPASAEPAPGQTFLQVSAVKKPEAELLVDVLAKKGFKARTAPVPDEVDLFRVLVGPVEDSTLASTRAQLEAAGFKSFPRKY